MKSAAIFSENNVGDKLLSEEYFNWSLNISLKCRPLPKGGAHKSLHVAGQSLHSSPCAGFLLKNSLLSWTDSVPSLLTQTSVILRISVQWRS